MEFLSKGELLSAQERIDDENVTLVGRTGMGDELSETLASGFAEHIDTVAAPGEAVGVFTRGYEMARAVYINS